MANTLCCCCFSNNVRHLILCLSVTCYAILFANLLLFNVAVLYRPNIVFSSQARQQYYITNSSELLVERRPRQAANEWNETQSEDADSSLSFTERELSDGNDTIINDIAEVNKNVVTNQIEHMDGHPIVAPEYDVTEAPAVLDLTTVTTTERKPPIFFTRSSPTTTQKASEALPDATAKTAVFSSSTKEGTKSVPHFNDKDISEGSLEKLDDKAKAGETPVPLNSTAEPAPLVNTNFGETVKFLLLWISPGFGMFFGTLLSVWLLKPLGIRKLFTGALLLSAAATLPLGFLMALSVSEYVVAGLRFFQGLAFGCVLPIIGTLTANWATLKGQFFFIVWSFLFIPLAPLVSWPMSGLLFGRAFKLPFILHAAAAFAIAIIWILFYRDRPQYHPWVNGLELNKIVTGKIRAIANRSVKRNTFSLLVTSFPVWAIWISAFSYFAVVALIVQYLPIYCYYVIDRGLPDGIYSASLPFLLMFGLTVFYPLWSRVAVLFSEKVSVKLFNTVSFIFSAAVFIFLALSRPNLYHSMAACALLMLALVLSLYGFYRSAIFVGRFFTQYIISYSQLGMAVAFVLVSILVYFFDRPRNSSEWRIIFLVISATQLLAAAVFVIIGSSKPEEWSKHSWDPSAGRRMVSVDQIDFHNDECGVLEMKLLNK